jgi:hypothetical protein
MKTEKRIYGCDGQLIGTIREAEVPSLTRLLVRFSLMLVALGIALTLI